MWGTRYPWQSTTLTSRFLNPFSQASLPAPRLRQSLLEWYDRHRRPLPWRTNSSLYRTVLSEFMLQQTQVSTVLPYFERWLKQFPDFSSLARAEEAAVLKAWEGLGYYSRARNLHKLARELVAMEAIPESYEAWLKLPGIGPYTAAAVTSIEFNQPEAVVDGNVIRVLARITANDTPFKDAVGATKSLRPLAQTLLDPHRPGDFNQALMELGATVCRPKKPTCLLCPWAGTCRGLKTGNPEAFPARRPRPLKQRSIDRLFLLRGKGGAREVLLEKIPDSARRLAGQFQLPEFPDKSAPPGTLPLLEKKRGISNERITERIFAPPPAFNPHKQHHWIPLEALPQVTIPGPHRRWIEELLEKKET